MRRHRVVLVLAGASAVWWAAPLAVTAAPAGGAVAWAGTWRAAIEVPGLGSLNKGGNAQLGPVSCGSAGNCAAGGFYTDGSGRAQATGNRAPEDQLLEHVVGPKVTQTRPRQRCHLGAELLVCGPPPPTCRKLTTTLPSPAPPLSCLSGWPC